MRQRGGGYEHDRRHAPPPGPRRVTTSLPDAARQIGAEGAIELAALRARWAELVGAQVADHCRPTALRGPVLTVVVDHNAWASQLRLLASEIVRRSQSVVPGVGTMVVLVGPSRDRGW